MKKIIGFIICLFLIATVLQIEIIRTESNMKMEKPVSYAFNSIVSDNFEVDIDSSKPDEISLIYDEYEIYVGEHWQLKLTVRWNPPDPQRPICLWVDTDTLPYGAMFPQGATSPQCVCDYGEVSGILDWTPTEEQVGTYQIVFYAGEICGSIQFYHPINISVRMKIPLVSIIKMVSVDNGETFLNVVDAYICSNVRFKLEIENIGNVELTNVVVNDTLPSLLSYADNATPFEPAISGNLLTWSFDLILKPFENITIMFDAHVNAEEMGENEAVVTTFYQDYRVASRSSAFVNGKRPTIKVGVVIENQLGFGVTTNITNLGQFVINEVLDCTIQVNADLIFLGVETVKQTPQPIPPGSSVEVTSDFVLGFGPANIEAKISFENEIIAKATANGFVFGPFVYIF